MKQTISRRVTKMLRALQTALIIFTIAIASSCKEDDVIIKTDPVITWENPADIYEDTALSATQLNATADREGTFVYNPALGTKLALGAAQDMKVTFNPTDSIHYNTATKTVIINVISIFTQLNSQMVNIPSGTFTMGSPTGEVNRGSDETQYQVTLSSFRMSKYEITNAQYAAFLNAKIIGSNGIWSSAPVYKTQNLIYASSGSYDWGLHYTSGQWIPVAGYENHPVIEVTWSGATEFATYAGGKLPTEAQWEYACRAGTTTPFNTGNFLTNLHANYYWYSPYSPCTNSNTNEPGKTQAVGTYSANAWGLFDMHGNVWEWCADWYGTYPTTAQTNPSGPLSGSPRVFRGGSWSYDAQYCRSAYRNYVSTGDGYYDVGFRVVLVP